MPDIINTLNEKPLHAALKAWYARPGDLIESRLGGYLIDIIRGELLIEIQTRNFSALRRKLARLTAEHPVRLVYPIARQKWIVRTTADGVEIGRRRSPKKGTIDMLFLELVHVPELMLNPNFSVEVLVIEEEEVRRRRARPRWRHEWTTTERRLRAVVESKVFEGPASMAQFLPGSLPPEFTARELAAVANQPLWLAQKVLYCLRRIGVVDMAGKRRNAYLYTRIPSPGA